MIWPLQLPTTVERIIQILYTEQSKIILKLLPKVDSSSKRTWERVYDKFYWLSFIPGLNGPDYAVLTMDLTKIWLWV